MRVGSDYRREAGFNRKLVERDVRAKLSDGRGLFTRNRKDSRELRRQSLVGPVKFTPEKDRYRFEGKAAIGRVLMGVADLPTCVASLTGFEPVLPP